MKKFILLPVFVLFALVTLSDANAVVQVVDGDANFSDVSPAFTSGTIATGGETGDDEAGDYVLIACATGGFGPNSLLPPSPGDWTELDNGQCGGPGCMHGIWGRFTDTAAVEDITCSWSVPQFIFAAGSFRYRDVDVDDPIIDVACQSGTGTEAVAPSIISEPRSQVIRLATFSFEEFRNFSEEENPCLFDVDQFSFAEFTACANFKELNVITTAFTVTGFEGGPTGEETLELFDEAQWRACTIGIRMEPSEPIPTLNEWGFMAVAAFMGIAGIWFLRRRQTQGA